MPRTRLLLVIALVLVSACHRPSLRDRARAMGGSFARFGGKVVAAVQPARPQVTVDVRAIAIGAMKQAAHARVDRAIDRAPALTYQKTVRRGADRPAPAPAPAAHREAPPQVTVTRVDAARPTMFVLRGQTHGGKRFCEAYTTNDECVSTCTAKLRTNAFAQPTSTTITSCSCLQQDGGC